jgi:hypothetical protein
MTGSDTARRLSELADACQRISANLLDLEAHPTVELLKVSELRGETAARWAAATATVARLFGDLEALRAVLERARRIDREIAFAPTRQSELRSLLDGPSIVTSDDPTLLAERSLTSASRTVVRSTPDELIARMAADFEAAKAVVLAVDDVWSEMVPALREARGREVELSALPADGSGAHAGALDAAGKALRSLSDEVLSDPLAVDRSRLAGVLESLDRIDHQCADLVQLRDHWDERIGAARQELTEAEDAVERCRGAVDAARSRIVFDHPIEPVDLPPGMGDELDRVVEADDEIAATAARLVSWRARVAACREAADRTRVVCLGMLDERDELRARLDAYHAKAAALERLESPALDERYDAARTVLYTAPTDLGVARRAVADYQRLLAEVTPTEVTR